MKKNHIIRLSVITGLFILGCSDVHRKAKLDVEEITRSDLEILLSEEMTIDALEKTIGRPSKSYIHDHRGVLFYEDNVQPTLTFHVMGPYITGAYWGKISAENYIKGITPHIFVFRVAHPVKSGFWVNDIHFAKDEDLMKYLIELPDNSILEYRASCMYFLGADTMTDIKDTCSENGILFVHCPSG